VEDDEDDKKKQRKNILEVDGGIRKELL